MIVINIDVMLAKRKMSVTQLSERVGITMANSPTVNVGYEVLSELPKERHEKPMLSLDKTKEISKLKIVSSPLILNFKSQIVFFILGCPIASLFK